MFDNTGEVKADLEHETGANTMEQKARAIEELCGARLNSAAWQGQALTIAMRLGLGEVDVNSRDKAGRTPLHHAAMRGNRETAEVLLSNGALVNARDGDGFTPLRWAMASGAREVTDLLREYGAR